LVADPDKATPPSRLLMLLEGRALWELGAFLAAVPLLRMLPRGDGHPVLVLPGFIASDTSTLPLRAFLKDRGYAAYGWEQGRNLGLRQGVMDSMLQRLKGLARLHHRKVSRIGWSLGGVYARELAKRSPGDVRLVVSLGSPFTGNPKANNAWRLYEAASGETVGDPRIHPGLRSTPPVPTTSIFSRSDGIVAWQCSLEQDGPQAENIEIEGSHCGLGHNPAALYAIADRLAQPEGKWRRFDSSLLNRAVSR
jgi:hypothetical protein